jgi:hypothetical protein
MTTLLCPCLLSCQQKKACTNTADPMTRFIHVSSRCVDSSRPLQSFVFLVFCILSCPWFSRRLSPRFANGVLFPFRPLLFCDVFLFLDLCLRNVPPGQPGAPFPLQIVERRPPLLVFACRAVPHVVGRRTKERPGLASSPKNTSWPTHEPRAHLMS